MGSGQSGGGLAQGQDFTYVIKLQENDNVGVALAELELGRSYPLVTYEGKRIREITIATEQPPWYASRDKGSATIRKYYKVATEAILKNSPIVKDGCPIGIAAEPVEPGQVVHQDIRNERGRLIRTGGNIQEYPNLFAPPPHRLQSLSEHYEILREGLDRPPNFRIPDHAPSPDRIRVYPRPDDSFGVRDHILVVPTVFCVNAEAQQIADTFSKESWGESGENYVHALTHTSGCCQLGFDEEVTLRVLSNMACHPNVGAVLIIALGCSPFCVQDRLYKEVHQRREGAVHLVHVQSSGRAAAVSEGTQWVSEKLERLRSRKREEVSVSDLVLAVKCGASDLTSGLFANTAIGHVADQVLHQNGTVLVSEIMEYYGAERMLKEKCRDDGVWMDLLRYIKTNEMMGKAVALAAERDLHSSELTVGNVEAGLSTQEEKSLGAIRKMGFEHRIENVVRFGESVLSHRHGLYVVDGPGQDLLSTSGMCASGAQVVLFSTGIGSPLGSAVSPVIKVTGNEHTFRQHGDFIDLFVPFQRMITDGAAIKEIAREVLYREVVAVVEGKRTKTEINRHRDFAIRNYMMVQ
jgi:altronate dehydratase large subunit